MGSEIASPDPMLAFWFTMGVTVMAVVVFIAHYFRVARYVRKVYKQVPLTLDQTDVQNLVDALPASGGDVLLDSGATYVFTGTVNFIGKTNVTVRGDGSTVIQQTTQDQGSFYFKDCSYVTLSRLILKKGNIVLVESNNCTFSRITAEDTDGSSILLDGQTGGGSAYNTVESCTVLRSKKVGISQNKATDTNITNNVCRDCGYEGLTVDNHSDRCIVVGNRFIANKSGVGQIGVDASHECMFQSNVIVGTATALTSGITFQNNISDTSQNVITGNIITDNQYYGIDFKTNAGYCTGNIVTGNRLQNNILAAARIESAVSTDNVFTSNCFGGGALLDNGTNTVVSANSQG